ncbi:MAG: translation initiation factor Sui1 [Desulfobulbaceae bacterium]|nr:translation initiation factor Sui1 [Desulfobulbaceae bacterium]
MRNKRSSGQTDGPVYSTDHGRMCPACVRPQGECICRQQAAGASGDGIVRVGRQTKGRKGKGVTLVTGVMLDGEGLKKLAGQLKKRCGSGGTVKDGVIEIQGDHRDTLVEELRMKGWKVKRTGGQEAGGKRKSA